MTDASSAREDHNSENLKDLVVEALEDMKALDITPLPVGETSSVADWFLVCSGTSETHCRAIAGEVGRKLKKMGILPLNSGEGGSAAWTLLDYGAVVLHVFSKEARTKYDLESVWLPKADDALGTDETSSSSD